jgi:hypothetical protein
MEGKSLPPGHAGQTDQASGDHLHNQQHEIVSSNQQLNSAISEDKIKTEKIGEHTVSPENTQRQDFQQNFGNINVHKEINQQSATGQQMQSVRLESPPNRLLLGQSNKLSLPVSQTKEVIPPPADHREMNTNSSACKASRLTKSNAQLDKASMQALNINTHGNGSPG